MMRVPRRFKEALQKQAKAEHRNLTGIIERVVEAYLLDKPMPKK